MDRDGTEVENVTAKEVMHYLGHLQTKGLENVTRRVRLGVIKSFFNYQMNLELREDNPVAHIKIRGADGRKLYPLLLPADLDKLFTSYEIPKKDDEQAFLDRLARKLDISEGDYKEILKDYQTHPVNPPTSYDRRLERLYDLARMVYADHELGERQTAMLERLGVGLGFSPANINYVVDKALKLVHAGVDEDNFKDEIKNMNR